MTSTSINMQDRQQCAIASPGCYCLNCAEYPSCVIETPRSSSKPACLGIDDAGIPLQNIVNNNFHDSLP
jgi:hypothetical protein